VSTLTHCVSWKKKKKALKRKEKKRKKKKLVPQNFFFQNPKSFSFQIFASSLFFLEDTHYRLVKDLTLTPLRMHPHKHTRSWLLD